MNEGTPTPDTPMHPESSHPPASLRRIPYPYRAMLAICSDLDETPDRQVYMETMKYLNTTERTAMGDGLGLEVGNTIYFDMPAGQFSYWNTDDEGRDRVRALIRSGHIDCLHSYGDLATTRAHAEKALEDLNRHGCRLEVWIDHATAPSNFGADIMHGSGDVPGSPVYHADLTCDYGIRYVWRGRVTSVVGQDVPRSLDGIFHREHPISSMKTCAKEFCKGIAFANANGMYAMHVKNEILREARLRDGKRIHEFMRSNPHWGGVSRGETADGIADVLVEPMLRRLVDREGMCVLYTHLGKFRTREMPFGPATRSALESLARYQREGMVLITTTRRLLGYCRAVRDAVITASRSGEELQVDITARGIGPDEGPSGTDLEGITLYVPSPETTHVSLNGRRLPSIRRNGPDHTGKKSVSIPRRPLEFPAI